MERGQRLQRRNSRPRRTIYPCILTHFKTTRHPLGAKEHVYPGVHGWGVLSGQGAHPVCFCMGPSVWCTVGAW